MKSPIIAAFVGIGLLLFASCGTNPENRLGADERPPMSGQSRPAQGPVRNGAGGRVESVEDLTITISNPEGTIIVVTTEATKFTKDGKASSLAEISQGLFIEVVGKKQSDGSWLAQEIAISDQPPRGGPQSASGPPRP